MNFKKPNIFQGQQTTVFEKQKFIGIQLILEFKDNFKKYRPDFSQNPFWGTHCIYTYRIWLFTYLSYLRNRLFILSFTSSTSAISLSSSS